MSLVSYRRESSKPSTANEKSSNREQNLPSQSDREKTTPYPDCGKMYQLFSKNSCGWNSKPYQRCENCWRKSKGRTGAENNSFQTIDLDPFGQISSIQEDNTRALHHQIFSKGE